MQRYTVKIEGTQGDEYLHAKTIAHAADIVVIACGNDGYFPGRPINITIYDKWKKKEIKPDLNYYFQRP